MKILMYKKRIVRKPNRALKKNREARRKQYNVKKQTRILKYVASESGDK